MNKINHSNLLTKPINLIQSVPSLPRSGLGLQTQDNAIVESDSTIKAQFLNEVDFENTCSAILIPKISASLEYCMPSGPKRFPKQSQKNPLRPQHIPPYMVLEYGIRIVHVGMTRFK